MDRMGGDYGGYYVPNHGINDKWIVYSFGVGEDVSFEEAIIDRYRCKVHAFDPTPRSILFANKAIEDLPELRFYPYGIGIEDGKVSFYPPRDPSHVSYSAHNIQGTETYVEMEVLTLDSIQSTLGHEHLDLLKMNIEGSELSILEDLAERQIEIPIIVSTLEAPVPFVRYKKTLDRLLAVGYTLVKSYGSTITLIHTAGWKARHDFA